MNPNFGTILLGVIDDGYALSPLFTELGSLCFLEAMLKIPLTVDKHYNLTVVESLSVNRLSLPKGWSPDIRVQFDRKSKLSDKVCITLHTK